MGFGQEPLGFTSVRMADHPVDNFNNFDVNRLKVTHKRLRSKDIQNLPVQML